MNREKPLVEIFCDGACKGNPGPGGWGAVLLSGDRRKEIKGHKARTTNNEMELTAAIEALKALKKSSRAIVSSDSNYVVRGMNEWIHGWLRNGWRSSGKQPVKNQELWKALLEAAGGHEVDWVWIRGHNGHPHNERADQLANEAIDAAGY